MSEDLDRCLQSEVPFPADGEMLALTVQVTNAVSLLVEFVHGRAATLPVEFDLSMCIRAALFGIEPWLRGKGIAIRVRAYDDDPLGYYLDWLHLLRGVSPHLLSATMPISECSALREVSIN